MKRISYLVLTVLAISLVFFNTNASAIFSYTVSSNLLIGGNGCPQTDVYKTFGQMTVNNTSDPLSYANTWNWTGDYDGQQRTQLTNFFTTWKNNLDAGNGFGVVANPSNSGFGGNSVAFYTWNPTANLIAQDTGIVTTSDNSAIHVLNLGYNVNAGCRYQSNDQANSYQNAYSVDLRYSVPVFLSALSITYPTGYTGTTIPATTAPPKPDFHPDIKYVVNGSDLVASYTGKNCIQDTIDKTKCIPFNIVWITNNTTGSTDDFTQALPPGQDFIYHFKTTGTHALFATYTAKGIPYAPLPDGYNYSATQASFTVDGTSFAGDSTTCAVSSGYCITSTVIYCDDMTNLVNKTVCKFNSITKMGIISTTLQGIVSVFSVATTINPDHCDITWSGVLNTSNITLAGHSNILPLQNTPQSICNNVEPLYIRANAPFHPLMIILNIVLSASAIMFLVFGILSLLGFKFHLPTPIQEEPGAGEFSGQGAGFGTRRTYLKGSGNQKDPPRGKKL